MIQEAYADEKVVEYTLALQENEFKNMTRDQLLSVRAGILKKAVFQIVSNSFGMLEAFVKTPMNAVISIVNGAISRINSIHFTVPDWVLGIGGKSWKGLNIPQIPTLSKGTDNWQGGIVQISEKGGEIVDLPRGTRVYPHDESVRMARSENKGTVITIAKLADSIIVREEADIDRIAERIVQKVKETNDNLPQTAVA